MSPTDDRHPRPGLLPACTLILTLLAAATAAEEAPYAEGETAPPAAEREVDAPARDAQEVIYDRVMVIGDAAALERVPGSATYLGREELERYQHSDVHRILRRVPGVSVQEEEGFGLRPNVGIRGTGVERSQKVTLLEDGVLIAPAPYAAPAAYYFPTAGRMSGIEVRKGSAAIKQGPFTLGGALNLISTPIPGAPEGGVDLAAGEDGAARLHGHYGASWQRFGFLVETFQEESDGFKRLDGGGDTGFELEDYLLKLRLNSRPGARVYQQLELKAGRTDQLGHETYLGLTADDFERTPFRRYAASAADRIDTEHEQLQLRYFVQPRPGLDVTTTLYRNDFFRNWRKNESTLGTSNGAILADPASHALELAYLRGELDSPDDAFALRNNRRDYYSQGIHTVVGWRLDTGRAGHGFELGVRYHEDEEDRFQEEDLFALRDGRMVLTTAGRPGSQANRIGEAEALAIFFQDTITFGRLTLTPGLRYETIDTRRLDYGKDDPTRSGLDLEVRENQVDALIPGLGVAWELSPAWTLFGGVHRGFAPPSPSSTEPVDAEESVSYELGTRFGRGDDRFEVTAFLSDYSNLLGADTASGGGTGSGDLFNGGEALTGGLELSFQTDLWSRAGLRVPLRTAYTFTHAEFRSSFETGFADWSPRVEKGDALPYVPEHRLFAEIGLEARRWSLFLGGGWVDAVRTKAGQGPIPATERIPGHTVVDLAGELTLGARYRLYAQVRNLFDETYVAARRPYGLRPGLPRTALVGFAVDF